MQEKTLIKVSVLMVIVGLFFLFLYAEKVPLKPVQQLDSYKPEEKVLMTGTINRVSSKDKVTFLELEGERIETNDVIVFPDEELFLQQGDYVEISGTVEEYNGKKEVIASKIVKK